MTQTTTPPAPEVPLLPGTHVISDWADWDFQYRLIWGERRDIADISISVQPCASQLPNGTIDDHGEPPAIMLDEIKEPVEPGGGRVPRPLRDQRGRGTPSRTRAA
jgi:hypothetical protein